MNSVTYIVNATLGEAKCPECGDTNLNIDSTAFDGGIKVINYMKCVGCGKNYSEVYKLSHIQEVDKVVLDGDFEIDFWIPKDNPDVVDNDMEEVGPEINYAVDIGFEIVSRKSFEELTQQEILNALMRRVKHLSEHWEKDAFDCFDEYEVEE